jgi:hypothetical protein
MKASERIGSIAQWRPSIILSEQVAMGQATDERLKLLGTRGLTVIDASVMPLHVCANTAAAIAEKGSDFIKED